MRKKHLLLFLFSFFTFCAKSQDSFISLKEGLNRLEENFQVSFSYADELAERIKVKSSSYSSLKEQLTHYAEQTGLEFKKAGTKTYLVVIPPHFFCIQVVNGDNGLPLDGAHLMLNNNTTNILTDKSGYAKFESKTTFQDTISIRYFGFDTKKVIAGALSAGSCPQVSLTFGKTTLREVVITSYITSGIAFSKEDQSLRIKTGDLALLPGETDGDILLAIKTLPGITTPNGKAGNLHFRGSTTDQTLVLFDNIPIYHKGHYFGTISPYNPVAIDEVRVYRSGYGPDLGGRVGGAIKLESYKNIPDSTHFGVGLNTSYGSAFADVRINDKFGINASVRSTYSGKWQSPKLKALNKLAFQSSLISRAENRPDLDLLENIFTFNDANLSTNYKIKNGSLSMSFLTIDNFQKALISNHKQNSIVEVQNNLDNDGLNLDWSQYWNHKFNTYISATFSNYKVESHMKEKPADHPEFIPDQFDQSIKDLSVNAEGNILLDPNQKSSLNVGYQINRHAIDGLVYSNRPNVPETSIKSDDEAYLHSLFISHQATFFGKLSVKSGVRNNYYAPLDYFRIEPRIFLNWQQNDRLLFKSSYGLYSQYIMQNLYFDFDDIKIENLVWDLASYEKPVIKSSQCMIGSTWKPGGLLIDLEFYNKYVSDLSTLKTDKTPTDTDRYTVGNLHVYGIDVLLKKQWNKIDTWISYSYTHTSMDFPEINLITFETYYDQPHTINLNATLPYRHWSFSIGWQYQSGVPVYTNNTFFPRPGQAANASSNEPVTAQKSEGRFPSQHQLDASVVYMFPKTSKPWNGSVGLSLLNLYDRRNLVAENYITIGPATALEQRYSIGFAPNIMLNLRW